VGLLCMRSNELYAPLIYSSLVAASSTTLRVLSPFMRTFRQYDYSFSTILVEKIYCVI